MANVLIFPGEHLEQADVAARDPAADLVVVRNLVDVSDRDFLRHRREVLERFDGLTPTVNAWWKDINLDKEVDELEFCEQTIKRYTKPLHIDGDNVVGYIATTNLGDTARSIYASRQGVPTRIANCTTSDHPGFGTYQRRLARAPIPQGEWVTLRPGDSALFGARPFKAKHATEGDTLQAVLTFWAPRWMPSAAHEQA